MSFSVALCRNNLLQHIFSLFWYVHFSRDLTLNLKETSFTVQVSEEWFDVVRPYHSSERDRGNGFMWLGRIFLVA
jgi:hypothetical protein